MYITCMTSLDILIYHDLSTYQKQRNTTSPGVIAHMCRAPRWSYVFMSYNIGENSLKTGDGAGDVLVQLVGDRMHLFGEILHLEAFRR